MVERRVQRSNAFADATRSSPLRHYMYTCNNFEKWKSFWKQFCRTRKLHRHEKEILGHTEWLLWSYLIEPNLHRVFLGNFQTKKYPCQDCKKGLLTGRTYGLDLGHLLLLGEFEVFPFVNCHFVDSVRSKLIVSRASECPNRSQNIALKGCSSAASYIDPFHEKSFGIRIVSCGQFCEIDEVNVRSEALPQDPSREVQIRMSSV